MTNIQINFMRHDIKIMGILNITENSFYKESRATTQEAITNRLKILIHEGADIIDIGACSTKPGSTPISSEEEWENISKAIQITKKLYPSIPISIDTFRADIVEKVYDTIGDFIVNDISAGEDDTNMLKLVGKLGLEYIAMHKRGTPATMQSLCQYDNVTKEVVNYFKDFAIKAEEANIKNWILDPGFGFAKTLEQNYEMIDNFEEFKELSRPILVGISRKSFIYKKLGITPEEALTATTELHKILIQKGANILRVHDVAAAKSLL